jgi:hypothetical protein
MRGGDQGTPQGTRSDPQGVAARDGNGVGRQLPPMTRRPQQQEKCRVYDFIVESGLIVAGTFRYSFPISPEEATLQAIEQAAETAKHLKEPFDEANLHVVVIPVFR